MIFQLACQLLKYAFFLVFGFAIACLISASFGAFGTVGFLFTSLGHWLWRLMILAICLVAAAIFIESLR